MPRTKRLKPQVFQTHIYLDKEAMRWLKKKADASGRSITAEIRQQVRERMESEGALTTTAAT